MLQRQQGPDLPSLWLLVGTPSVLRPEFSPKTGGAHSVLFGYHYTCIYLFDIIYLLLMLFVFRFLLPLRLVWLLVCCLYKEVYLHIFKRASFWLHGCCGEWGGWVRKSVNHTSWVAVVTPTDRPKLVHNRCVIELFDGVFCHFARLPFLLIEGLLS